MITSKRFAFVKEDWLVWGKNALVFTIPVWIMLVGMILNKVDQSTFWGGLVAYLLSQLLAWLRYWARTHNYEVTDPLPKFPEPGDTPQS